MRVVVVGGLGYLGGRICSTLSDSGHHVTATADRWNGKVPRGVSEVSVFDVTDARETAKAIAGARPDAVVQLAALNEIDSLENPRRAYAVNCDGTFNVLEAAADAGAKRALYMSTFHVYGLNEGYISEDTPTFPSHPYATTHRAAEDMVRYFARNRGIAAATLRLSNGYGAPSDPEVNRWTLVFNDLCRQAVMTGEIILATTGGQHRDFVPLHDVGRAVVHALESDQIMGGGDVFNLGGRCSRSIRQVAELIATIASRELGHPVNIKAPPGKPEGKSVDYDMGKLEATGFRLTGSMEEEIIATLRVCEELSRTVRGLPSAQSS